MNKRNVKSYSTNLTEGNGLIAFPENKKICIFKSENKDGKKVFNQIKEEEDEKI